MKRLFVTAAVLSLMGATSAVAQHQDHRDGAPAGSTGQAPAGQGLWGGQSQSGPQGHGAQGHAAQGPAAQGHGAQGQGAQGHGSQVQGGPGTGGQGTSGQHTGGIFGGGPTRTGPFPYVPGAANDRPHADNGGQPPRGVGPSRHLGRDGFGVPGFNKDSADRPRFDQRYFPRQLHANRRFTWRGDRHWVNQPGYYRHRWAYGEFLPLAWIASAFWIDSYFLYDLPTPPYGYQWVRVGSDALLVDAYTGEVVEVVYGLF